MPVGAAPPPTRRLTEVRRHVPDAGGLVIATDQTQARAYAKILRAITGEKPVVVLSDDAGVLGNGSRSSPTGDQRWMVAVRMVSEGVDVPRLAVGVYATSTSTPLFFAQAVGRFVRARRRGETASVFLPSVPLMLEHAARAGGRARPRARPAEADDAEDSMWAPEDALLAAANRTEAHRRQDQLSFEALESEAAVRPGAVRRRASSGSAAPRVGSEEEQDYLGLPGLLEPDQVATLLRERQAAQRLGPRAQGGRAAVSAHRALAATAQGAQRAGLRLRPQERRPARRRAHRPAAPLRRAGRGPGQRRAGRGADRDPPPLVRRPPLSRRPAIPAGRATSPQRG